MSLQRRSIFINAILAVDEIAFCLNNQDPANLLKNWLKWKLKVKLLERIHFFSGWKIATTVNGVHLCKSNHAERLLEEVCPTYCNPHGTSLPISADVSGKHDDGCTLSVPGHKRYRPLVCGLLYLAIGER